MREREERLNVPTACNFCGGCCDPVVMPFTQAEAIRMPPTELDAAHRKWVLNDLTPMSYHEGIAKMPHMRGQSMATASGELSMPFFFRCRWFDNETRLCTNYENRPEVCSSYPWGGRPPRSDAALPPQCSFNADIGRPVALLPTKNSG